MIECAYVHVPFCSKLCSYCAFDKSLDLGSIEPWLETVSSEIADGLSSYKQANPSFALDTVYFGGGTPSLLSVEQIRQLAGCFAGYAKPDAEWTIEANPESISKEKLAAWKQAGINRISIGIQSFDDSLLQRLGRSHSAAQAQKAVILAKEAGFERISADLMYGFAWQSLEDLDRDLDDFLALEVDHLSIYSLILEERSVMGVKGENGADEDLCAAMYERIVIRLCQAGYEHYETSSFARNGQYSRHNLKIWQDAMYFGFGWGGCGRDENGLYHHEQSLRDYLKNGPAIEYDENPNPWFDALMTGFRTKQGVNVPAWNDRYQMDFFSRYADVLERYADRFRYKDGFLSLDEEGMEILDTILVEFLMKD